MRHSTQDTKKTIFACARNIIVQKGFAAVGLNEILSSAGVPKGSFYHYFSSKDHFGEELLKEYFDSYIERLNLILSSPNKTGRQLLGDYFDAWVATQNSQDHEQMCLAVKLGGEVSDLSESMRKALCDGTQRIMLRIAQTVLEGVQDGSITGVTDSFVTAQMLYSAWVGASLLEKMHRNGAFFELTNHWTSTYLAG